MSDRSAAGRKARNKGYRFECEIRRACKKLGAVTARTAGSRGFECASGYHFGDVIAIFDTHIEIIDGKAEMLTDKEMEALAEDVATLPQPPGLKYRLWIRARPVDLHYTLKGRP